MVEDLRQFVCSVDGKKISRARSGKWVHVEELDEKTPEHDVDPIEVTTFNDVLNPLVELKRAAGEMINHHATVHPVADCEWHRRLLEAWRRV